MEIVNEQGRRLARRRLPEGLDGITRLHALIAQFFPEEWADLEPAEAASRVKVGIETERGPWVAALIAAGRGVAASQPPRRRGESRVLIDEFGVETRDAEWRSVLREGRADWRRKQLAAAVRDCPQQAAEALRRRGWAVSPPPEGGGDAEDLARLTAL